MSKKHVIIPIFIPHKGCPFDCIYCNQKTISGQTEEMTESQMRHIISSHLQYIGQDTQVEIGFYGGSFTGIPEEQQIRYLEIAGEYIGSSAIQGIRLSTRPDYIRVDILKYLKEYHVKLIELGVQSLDEEVLKKSCRGHGVGDVLTAAERIKDAGIKLGIQTMIGLPGDTYEKDIHTAERVIQLKPDVVRIYPALVIRGTYMESMYRNKVYVPLALDEAVQICAILLEKYEDSGIQVIRIGLQPTDTINEQIDVVAGPFHPAFRQLVESRRMLNCLEKKFSEKELYKEGYITLYTGNKYVSDVVGQNKSNLEYLKSKYKIKNIKVKSQEHLGREIVIHASH